MTKTCLQCGAVLLSSARGCDFCNSSLHSENPEPENLSSLPAPQTFVSTSLEAAAAPDIVCAASLTASEAHDAELWRAELAQRMEAYRVRKRRGTKNAGQSRLPFDSSANPATASQAIALAEATETSSGEFSFSLAIGPQTPQPEKHDSRIEIDVSSPAPRTSQTGEPVSTELSERYGLYPVASLDERRIAAFIDAACLLFAYGGFVALFGSLGGQFTVSKLSAAVYGATIAIVYLQYFALFTIFGGTTPGMMFRGLQVTSFTGDPPTPRQMLLRSLGYVLSAGTFFLGFFWAWWDEDALTWHDRLSRTYLSAPQPLPEFESSAVAHGQTR